MSRYKLDAYLQLFDFPPPNISAEKRFTTTVPLQRLFLMNSDFVQLEAEALYKRFAANRQSRPHPQALQPGYNRDPKEAEIQMGLDYLRTEPAKEYEESKTRRRKKRRTRREKDKAEKTERRGKSNPAKGAAATALPKTA